MVLSATWLAKTAPGALAAFAGAAVTFVVVDSSDPAPAPAAQAWIDQPLDGSSHGVDAPVAITVHVTDPDGVAAVTVTVDGGEIHASEVDGDDHLVTIELDWDPVGPGTYELGVVGEDGGGAEGLAATATFTVGDAPPEETATTTPPGDTTTTAPTTSTEVTPPGGTTESTTAGTAPATTAPGVPTTGTTQPPTTLAPCRPSAPQLVNPPDDADVTTRRPRFTWSHAGCAPTHFTVQVATNDSFVGGPDQYLKAANVPAPATNLTWFEDLACSTTYYWRVRATGTGGASAWSGARSVNVVPPRC